MRCIAHHFDTLQPVEAVRAPSNGSATVAGDKRRVSPAPRMLSHNRFKESLASSAYARLDTAAEPFVTPAYCFDNDLTSLLPPID